MDWEEKMRNNTNSGIAKKELVIFVGLVTVIALGTVLYVRSDTTERTNGGLTITANTDSDGDGIPDWQEEVTNTDPNDPQSFPYRGDLAIIEDISVDELLNAGPGDFVETVIQRLRDAGPDAEALSKADEDRFGNETADYFYNQVLKRGLPVVNLQINENADRQALANAYLAGIQGFASLTTSLETLIFSLLGNENPPAQEVQHAIRVCEAANQILPREMVQEVYEDYLSILQRILFTCEALKVARTNPIAEDYFYILRLFQESNPNIENPEVSLKERQQLQAEQLRRVYEVLTQ